MVRDAYGDTVSAIAPATAGIGLSVFYLDGGNDWNLGNTLLMRSADLGLSICVDFTAIYTQCLELRFTVPGRFVDVLELVLQCLDAVRKSGKSKSEIPAQEASEAEQLAKITLLIVTTGRFSIGMGVLSINWLLLGSEGSVMKLWMWKVEELH